MCTPSHINKYDVATFNMWVNIGLYVTPSSSSILSSLVLLIVHIEYARKTFCEGERDALPYLATVISIVTMVMKALHILYVR